MNNINNVEYYSSRQFQKDVEILAKKINHKRYLSIFGVPRGGIPIAIALSIKLGLPIVTKIASNTLVVDDLIDSGETRKKYMQNDFACIHIKMHTPTDLYPTYYVEMRNKWAVEADCFGFHESAL